MNIKTTAIKILCWILANFQPTNGFYVCGWKNWKKNSLCETKFQILDKMAQKLKANKTSLERKTLDL